MAESAPLLREYGLIPHRGFESLPLRQPIISSECEKTMMKTNGGMQAPRQSRSFTFEVMNKDAMNMSWSLDSRRKLALAAVEFFDFDMKNRSQMVQYLPDRQRKKNRDEMPPFSLLEFAQYLEAKAIFPKKPNHFRVQHLVARMASLGFLVHIGYAGRVPALFGEQYICFRGMFGEHFRGDLWLAPLLGPEFLYEEAKSGIVHLTGTRDGKVVGGTGVVIHPNYILTCRHVVAGVNLNALQELQGRQVTVDIGSTRIHQKEDIALIRINQTLTPLNGAVFRKPVVAQSVYTMGYPKLPNTRDASLTIQPGAVTNESVTSLGGQALFLYSAISRPGSSGGPVLSEDGFIVGIVAEDHSASYAVDDSFSPHYAGVPAPVVVESVEELAPEIQLVVENFE